MNETTNRLKLPLLIPNQSGKEFTHNEALIIIDNLLQNHIISKTLNTPPLEPNIGDMYIVADLGTGDWENKDNQLAIYDNGWRFIKLIEGMLFYVLEENCFYIYKNEWKKLENFIDFAKLKNIAISNLQKDDIIKYDGTNFLNTREINLLKLYINNKFLIDENLNVSIKNNDDLINIISITAEEIDFKNNIKISGVIIDDYISNIINSKIGESIANIGRNYLVPDYTSAIDIKAEITTAEGYTTPEKGVICLSIGTISGGVIEINIFINDVNVGRNEVNNPTLVPFLNGEYIVDKDDIIKITQSGNYLNIITAIFCPFKNISNNDNINNNQGE